MTNVWKSEISLILLCTDDRLTELEKKTVQLGRKCSEILFIIYSFFRTRSDFIQKLSKALHMIVNHSKIHVYYDVYISLPHSIFRYETQLLLCTCMHVPISHIIILNGKCNIRKIRCIICFTRVYQLLLRFILFSSHVFIQICIYAYRSWSLCILSKLEHTIFLRRCIQSVYLPHAFCA